MEGSKKIQDSHQRCVQKAIVCHLWQPPSSKKTKTSFPMLRNFHKGIRMATLCAFGKYSSHYNVIKLIDYKLIKFNLILFKLISAIIATESASERQWDTQSGFSVCFFG
jgi:hypothetical protein